MKRFSPLAVVLAAAVFLTPLSAYALGISFGGHVAAVVPCTNGALYVTVINTPVPVVGPFGTAILLSPISQPPISFYVWTPFTLRTLAPPTPSIPPFHPGQYILGVYDIPFVCFIGTIPFVGWRMQVEGVGL